MRSYALQGFHNQGTGELMPDASYRLLLKTIYLDWLFNGAGRSVDVNTAAVAISGFVVGLAFCVVAAVAVSLCSKGEDGVRAAGNKVKKRNKKKQ